MRTGTSGLKVLGIALVMSLTATTMAAAGPKARVYVRVGPPAAVVDVRGVAPSRSHVWVGGYHRWAGDRYVWVAGGWSVPPRPHAVWVAGHWERSRNGHYWVEGHWR